MVALTLYTFLKFLHVLLAYTPTLRRQIVVLEAQGALRTSIAGSRSEARVWASCWR